MATPLKRAGIGHRALKDLRDTFASQLLTAGVQLGYVSAQLGHADVAVTARHYARWIEGEDGYREPLHLEPGELPADLLARLAPESDPTVTPLDDTADGASRLTAGRIDGIWRAQHDSNVRPPGPQPETDPRNLAGLGTCGAQTGANGLI